MKILNQNFTMKNVLYLPVLSGNYFLGFGVLWTETFLFEMSLYHFWKQKTLFFYNLHKLLLYRNELDDSYIQLTSSYCIPFVKNLHTSTLWEMKFLSFGRISKRTNIV